MPLQELPKGRQATCQEQSTQPASSPPPGLALSAEPHGISALSPAIPHPCCSLHSPQPFMSFDPGRKWVQMLPTIHMGK